jgi:hypothetical protein
LREQGCCHLSGTKRNHLTGKPYRAGAMCNTDDRNVQAVNILKDARLRFDIQMTGRLVEKENSRTVV